MVLLSMLHEPFLLLALGEVLPDVHKFGSWEQFHVALVVLEELHPDPGMTILHALKSFIHLALECHILWSFSKFMCRKNR